MYQREYKVKLIIYRQAGSPGSAALVIINNVITMHILPPKLLYGNNTNGKLFKLFSPLGQK